MKRQQLHITNKLGLHLRASSMLAQLSSKYVCDIWIRKNQKKVNAKSVLGLTMLAAGKGAQIEIECTGKDEILAIKEIVKLFESNFYEED